METGDTGGEAGAPRLGWLKTLVLILAALVCVHSVTFVAVSLPGVQTRVRSEVYTSTDQSDRTAPSEFVHILTVAPGGMFEAAGVRPGDYIRFEIPTDVQRANLARDTTYRLTVIRDGRSHQTSFRTPPPQWRGLRVESFISGVLALCTTLAGVVIALRANRRLGVLLGGALVAISHLGSFPASWENDIVAWFPVAPLWSAIMTTAVVAIFALAVFQRADATRRPAPRPWLIALWAYAVLSLVDWANQSWATITLSAAPLPQPVAYTLFLSWGGYFAAMFLLIRAAFETVGQDRTRLGFLAAAIGLYFGGSTFVGVIINLTGNDFSFANPVAVLGSGLEAAGIFVFLYAALRHRVVDLGFAVNRTLVFGALSTTLLFAFFFAEWGAEQVIPAEMREASLLASAGIAFSLFLVFHKIRDWVEKGVETLFFRRWRDNEAELQRFVRQAAFVTRPDTLRQSSVAAFSRFADGADVALYGAALSDYRIEAGNLPGQKASLDPDLDMLVRLRAEREALEDGLSPGVALALPLLHRNELTGVFVLGPKPSGELYRPDEVSALADAALRIGLDLHALSIEALEAENHEQRRRAELLERQMQNLLKTGAPA